MSATEPMPLASFALPAPELAQALLSTVLFHRETAGMIIETEAYLGGNDLASHSARGQTKRTRVLFGPPGRAYIYLIYGIYECLNVVAGAVGTPGCVLIRALEPLSGLPVMYKRRQITGSPATLTNGPGKLTQALGITGELYGHRLDKGALRIRRWRERPIFETAVTPRIGITQCIDWPLRFVWAQHPCLSRGRA
jgi:DNA-3-methyladenine glycosylase